MKRLLVCLLLLMLLIAGCDDSTETEQAAESITNTIGMKLKLIPAGTFMMGSPKSEADRNDDEHQHMVTISKAFYMQTTEVTQGQWKAVMGTEPWKKLLKEGYDFVREGTDYPAVFLKEDDALTFIKKLNEKEGETYRLPTEAEWEYACRAGTKTTWSFGNDESKLGDYAWYKENAANIDEEYAHQVGLKKPNAFGLHDMHGNVWEFCGGGGIRGGAWADGSSAARSDCRKEGFPVTFTYWMSGCIGIRLVREVDSPEKAAAAVITAAIAKGDWETVLALDATNIEGLRLKATAITVALAKGDWETVLALDATNSDGLRIKAAAEKAAILARNPITNTLGMTLHTIPAGTFTMGSPEDETDRRANEHQHEVTISKAFYMQTTEVTQGQWKAVMGTEPWKGKSYGKERSDYPAVYVSWDDAVAYCKKLSEKEGKTYRLPTEAQWEYACRAGTKTTRSFGNNENALGDYAWYEKNAYSVGEKYAHQVGLKKPNAFGLYDMHGNVFEWCHDYYGEDYYQQSPEKDPTGPTSGSSRVLRGGSWYHNSRFTRSALRISLGAGSHYGLGFRLVRELD